jgi:hypothetical protein
MKSPKDWKQPCPNPKCKYYTLIGRGNVIAISTYLTQSGKRRIFPVKSAKHLFQRPVIQFSMT